jgi:L-threonylcarbamoyladenylate synthase
VKGRDPAMAVPLIAASVQQVRDAIGLRDGAPARLADVFWPGPLSLILDAPPAIAADVHGGRGTVAVRVPADAVARALAAAFGAPITATSANISGAPPVDRAEAIGAVARHPRVFVIDGGVTPGGAASTIVDARGAAPICVRAGAVPWDRVLTSL